MAGLNQIFSLADDVARYAKACGKRSVLEVKPASKGIKINPQEIRCESVFGKSVLIEDKTLNPNFLNELMEIKGITLEKVEQIKNKMLKTMGYDPTLVKVERIDALDIIGAAGVYCPERGVLGYTSEWDKVSQSDMIAMIRHELDHFEKNVGIIKKVGIQRYKNVLTQNCIKQGKKAEDIIFDDQFLHSVARDCKEPQIFDTKKYLNAIENYSNNETEYFTNALEKNAYNIQGRVGRFFDPKYITSKERQPNKRIMSLLKELDLDFCSKANMETIYDIAKLSDDPKFWEKLNTALRFNDASGFYNEIKMIKDPETAGEYAKLHKQVEEFLNICKISTEKGFDFFNTNFFYDLRRISHPGTTFYA